MIVGTPCKLDDGWGARVPLGPDDDLGIGDELIVQARKRKPWVATVTEIVARYDDAAIVRTRGSTDDDPPTDPVAALEEAEKALASAFRAVRSARKALEQKATTKTPITDEADDDLPF